MTASGHRTSWTTDDLNNLADAVAAGGGGGGDVPFVGESPPDSPTDGELWWDTDDDTPADGGSQTVQQVQVDLLSADILALGDTPKVLVTGVAGVILLPLLLNITPGAGTAYVFGANVLLELAPTTGAGIDFQIADAVTYALANSVQSVKAIVPSTFANSSDSFDVRGQPLILQVQDGGGNPTGGTLDAVVTLLYATMTGTA